MKYLQFVWSRMTIKMGKVISPLSNMKKMFSMVFAIQEEVDLKIILA